MKNIPIKRIVPPSKLITGFKIVTFIRYPPVKIESSAHKVATLYEHETSSHGGVRAYLIAILILFFTVPLELIKL